VTIVLPGGSRHPRSPTLHTGGSKRPMLRTARGLRRDPWRRRSARSGAQKGGCLGTLDYNME
jgi:hypothetical protein